MINDRFLQEQPEKIKYLVEAAASQCESTEPTVEAVLIRMAEEVIKVTDQRRELWAQRDEVRRFLGNLKRDLWELACFDAQIDPDRSDADAMVREEAHDVLPLHDDVAVELIKLTV